MLFLLNFRAPLKILVKYTICFKRYHILIKFIPSKSSQAKNSLVSLNYILVDGLRFVRTL